MDQIEVGLVYMHDWPAGCLFRTANASMPFSSRSLFDMETFLAEFASNTDYSMKLSNSQRILIMITLCNNIGVPWRSLLLQSLAHEYSQRSAEWIESNLTPYCITFIARLHKHISQKEISRTSFCGERRSHVHLRRGLNRDIT